MKTGKISENVLKRSVLKYIHKRKEEVIKGAETGADCAFLRWQAKELAVSSQTVSLPIENAAFYAVHAAANNLAAGGVEPVAVTVAVTLPADVEEVRLQALMKQADEACEELGIQIVGGHTEVTDSVNAPVITVTAFGHPMEDLDLKSRAADGKAQLSECGKQQSVFGKKENLKGREGLSVLMTKWIGLEGTAIIAKEKEAELLTRYPAVIVREAKGFDKYLPILPEAATAAMSGVCAMHDVRCGGVFGALFELSKSTGVGLSVDLKKIPVKQETIEICEFYDLNPYELLSGGCLLMIAEDGKALLGALHSENIPAEIIGRTIAGNDKIVINGDETRYIEPAKPDEILKIKFDSDAEGQITGKEK